MSPVLRVAILAAVGVALFFIGLAVGIVSDSDVRQPMYEEVRVEVPVPFPVPVHVPGRVIRVPVPFAIADEQIGAYRVNGFVEFRGRGPAAQMRVYQSRMACFPLEG